MSFSKIAPVLLVTALLFLCTKNDRIFDASDAAAGFESEISGTVVDRSGHPIAGAIVSSSEQGAITVSGVGGTFRLPGLHAGEHTLSVYKENYLDTAISAGTIGIAEKRTGDSLRIRYRYSTIEGTVIDKETGDTIALAGVKVRNQDASDQTFADGSFRLSHVEPGRVNILAIAPGTGFGTDTVETCSDSTISGRILYIDRKGGTLSGTVVDSASVPIKNATVTVIAGILDTTTDTLGRFSLSNVPSDGPVDLLVSRGSNSMLIGGLTAPENDTQSVGTVLLMPLHYADEPIKAFPSIVNVAIGDSTITVRAPIQIIDSTCTVRGYSWNIDPDTSADTLSTSPVLTFRAAALTDASVPLARAAASSGADSGTYFLQVRAMGIRYDSSASPTRIDTVWSNPASIIIFVDQPTTVRQKVSLTVLSSADSLGTVSVKDIPLDISGSATVRIGDTILLSATADSEAIFVRWMDGTKVLGTNPDSLRIVIDGTSTITGEFALRPVWTLNVAISDSAAGVVTIQPDKAAYIDSTAAVLTATPNSGYAFVNWVRGSTFFDSAAQIAVVMTADLNLTAVFADTGRRVLTIISDHGVVARDKDSSDYAVNTEVILTATPDAGWLFAGWSGALSGSQNPDTVTLATNTTVTATYTAIRCTLTVTSDHGTVVKDKDSTDYFWNSEVALTATPDAGWLFAGWSGALSGSQNPDTVTLATSDSVTALYTAIRCTLTVIPPAGGSIQKDRDSTSYPWNTTVQLTATPDANYSFVGWTHALSGATNPKNITLTGNDTVSADFVRTYALTDSSSDTSQGVVTIYPVQSSYDSGTVAIFRAAPAVHYRIDTWNVDGTTVYPGDSTENWVARGDSLELTVGSASTVIASFIIRPTYQISMNMSVPPFALFCTDSASGIYNAALTMSGLTVDSGTTAQIVCRPDSGYTIKAWPMVDGGGSEGVVRHGDTAWIPVNRTWTGLDVTLSSSPLYTTVNIFGETFPMGRDMVSGSTGAINDQGDSTHMVTISDFRMDNTEVTQREYARLVHTCPATFLDTVSGPDFPIENITWYDAAFYCNARSKSERMDTVYVYSDITGAPGNGCTMTGLSIDTSRYGYRLPTEAEWEYAAKGGNSRLEDSTYYFFGNDTIDMIGLSTVYNQLQTAVAGSMTDGGHPLGLLDMYGNVAEWCNDWKASYGSSVQTDPTVFLPGTSTQIYRGGAWSTIACRELRSTWRKWAGTESERSSSIGFRVIRRVPGGFPL